MWANKNACVRVDIDAELVDADDARFLSKERTCDSELFASSHDANGKQALKALGFFYLALRNLDTALFGKARCIDIINFIFHDRVQNALEDCGRQKPRVDARDLTLIGDFDFRNRPCSKSLRRAA